MATEIEIEDPSPKKIERLQSIPQPDEDFTRELGYILGPIKQMPSNYNDEIQMRLNVVPIKEEPGQDEQIVYSSDSDTGLPPVLPVANKPSFNLKIQGLGLSTVAKEGGKTAEEIAD